MTFDIPDWSGLAGHKLSRSTETCFLLRLSQTDDQQPETIRNNTINHIYTDKDKIKYKISVFSSLSGKCWTQYYIDKLFISPLPAYILKHKLYSRADNFSYAMATSSAGGTETGAGYTG